MNALPATETLLTAHTKNFAPNKLKSSFHHTTHMFKDLEEEIRVIYLITNPVVNKIVNPLPCSRLPGPLPIPTHPSIPRGVFSSASPLQSHLPYSVPSGVPLLKTSTTIPRRLSFLYSGRCYTLRWGDCLPSSREGLLLNFESLASGIGLHSMTVA